MDKYGLILEGGGMRGIYTAGVLDFFIENNIEINSCYGVSAGTVNACNYISKQKGRTYDIDTGYLDNRDYASVYNLITTGNYFGTEMCYHKIPMELNPFDFETYNKFDGDFYAVVTNCETGKPEYMKINDMKKDIDIIRASCSLPLMAQMVKIGEHNYLDGGVSDSIPVRQSVKDGNNKNVVILTRDIDYRKKANEMLPIIKLKYKKYPNLVKAIEQRHISYNRTLEYIENQRKAGNIFVIRPEEPVKIGRLEKSKEKLDELYRIGIKDAKKNYEKLKEFLGI